MYTLNDTNLFWGHILLEQYQKYRLRDNDIININWDNNAPILRLSANKASMIWVLLNKPHKQDYLIEAVESSAKYSPLAQKSRSESI